MVLAGLEREQIVIDNQVNDLNRFGVLLRTNLKAYNDLTSKSSFSHDDYYLKRHSPRGFVEKRNQIRDEDLGNFDRLKTIITSLWQSHNAVQQSQAEFLLRRLYQVARSHQVVDLFNFDLSKNKTYSNKILYDDQSISNLADSIMVEETEAGKSLDVTPVTVFGPVTGNRISFGKKAMVAEFALPMTPGNSVANPLENIDFTAPYENLKKKFIQLERDYAKYKKEDTSQVEAEFDRNSLPSKLVAEATTNQPTDQRELAMASARGLRAPPSADQRMLIESQILEFVSYNKRPETIRRLSLPQDQGSDIPAIEITVAEMETEEEIEKRRISRKSVFDIPKSEYIYHQGGYLFKSAGKYLLYFKDGKLHFSFDYETAKPQDMVSRMKGGLDYFNRVANRLYEYYQLEPRTVILPLDDYREKTLVDFERIDHHTIEERVEHLGGYNHDTLSRIEKFRDDAIGHFQEPDKGKPQNLFLTGPTGAGKTTITRALAKAFGENGIPVYKLSDREPINTDTLTRTLNAFTRNKEGGVLVIEDLVDYLNEATPEQFRETQASLIQTLKKLADMPNHVVIYNSERLDDIGRVALFQSHRTDMMFLEPDTSDGGIESLLRATMARSLSTDDQILTKDSKDTTAHLNRISGNNLANFIQQIQHIDQDFLGIGLTPNIVGTTSRTINQAGQLDWKGANMDQILAGIRQNMDTKSRLNPESPFEKARLTAEEYEILVRFLQEIQKAGGIGAWKESIPGPLIHIIEELKAKVAELGV